MSEQKFNEDLMKIYGWSKNKNFRVVDTIPTKHHYTIGPQHIAKSCGPYLDVDEAERQGVRCAARFTGGGRCQMTMAEHTNALLVQCLKEPTNENKYGKELQAYLKKIIKLEHFKSKKYEGAALMSSFKKEEE